MAVLLANNATSRLASSLTAAATMLSVTTGEGAKFPSPTGGDWFPLTLIKSSGALEILRCTSRSGDVLTVTRAQEGTAAQAFSAGDRVEVRLTKAVIDAIVQQINGLTNSALLDANNLSDLTNAATARTNLGLGTAATATLTTSSTDATDGRVTRVGDFGLGGVNVAISGTDLNALGKTGFYMGDALTNSPDGVSWYYVIHQEHFVGAGYSSQIAIDLAGVAEKIYARKKVAGSWAAWREIYHTGNVSAFAQTLLDDANAAAARATLGAPAGVDKQICTAWVNFNGTGTVAIRDSFNVSSITDNNLGDYTVNFSTPMANANYAPVVAAHSAGIGSLGVNLFGQAAAALGPVAPTVNGFRCAHYAASGANYDPTYVSAIVFGGK